MTYWIKFEPSDQYGLHRFLDNVRGLITDRFGLGTIAVTVWVFKLLSRIYFLLKLSCTGKLRWIDIDFNAIAIGD